MYTLVLALLAVGVALAQQTPDQCSCGYYDPSTEQLFTESIVIYFNETKSLPTDFVTQQFQHKKEKGWTSIYREGATPDNVAVGNQSQPTWLDDTVNANSLELYCNPGTKDHLVLGGALASIRQDIQYGSFRASMRSPHPWAGGSALSMQLDYNSSSIITVDMMNMQNSSEGRVGTLMNSEYPNNSLLTNYSIIQNGSEGVPGISPWNYMEVKIDWTDQWIDWSINNNVTRSVTGQSVPKAPAPLVFKHWSTGDKEYMAGPPINRSAANVEYIRAFFNSSLMTSDQHKSFDERCQPTTACSMDDVAIRGSTTYNATAAQPWKEPPKNVKLVYRSAIVAGCFGFFGFFVLIHAVLARWVPWHWLNVRRWTEKSKKSKNRKSALGEYKGPGDSGSSQSTLMSSGDFGHSSHDYRKYASTATTAVNSRVGSASNSRAASPVRAQHDAPNLPFIPRTKISDMYASTNSSTTTLNGTGPKSSRATILGTVAEDGNPFSDRNAASSDRDITDLKSAETPQTRVMLSELRHPHSELSIDRGKFPVKEDPLDGPMSHVHPHLPHPHDDHHVATTSNFHTKNVAADEMGARRDPVRMISDIPAQAPAPPKLVAAPQNVRIDYLAGCVAFACICVTFVHFVLTFLPGVTQGSEINEHSKSDYWSKKTIGPYLLSEAWIGPFFTTSSRFLTARYFRTGKLADVGNKALLRAPRLITPILIIALMQYFLISMGLTNSLQYLPSISWSTWPYVTTYPNFGVYMNAMLDLAYVIPNAAPVVVPYYCIGVLWTIPVQLQFSYVVLLGAVMVKEIKTHWKRFAFYFFVIANYWYAFNWGSMFWLGLMLSDLSVTYKYKEWIHARPLVHYSICTAMWISAFAACTVFLAASDLNYDFLTPERGIHPDWDTGLLISETVNKGYPNYFEPRLNTLVLAGSLQVIVELSVLVQKFLSLRVWTMIFPHIMTIYMIHGFIFWTWGAWLCVTLDVAGVPYWANMLVTVVLCYGLLAVAASIITPLTDKVAKNACKNLWRWASEEPVPKRPTLGTYSKNLILNRQGLADTQGTAA